LQAARLEVTAALTIASSAGLTVIGQNAVMVSLRSLLPAALLLALATGPVHARAIDIDDRDAGGAAIDDLPSYLQCVPYARQVSGIRIYGDAHTCRAWATLPPSAK